MVSTQTEKEQAGLRDCVNSGAVTGKRDNVGAELTFAEDGAFPAPPAGARRALGLESGFGG